MVFVELKLELILSVLLFFPFRVTYSPSDI